MTSHTSTRVDGAKIYTMKQLNQDTGGVLREIAESGQPALVTRTGRFVAKITPVSPSSFEALAIAALLEGDSRDQYTGDRTADGLASSNELISALDRDDGEIPSEHGPTADRSERAICTMRRLSHHTADVIRSINEVDDPALITRHGRVVAVISPLASARLEEVALAAILEMSDTYMGAAVAANSSPTTHTAEDLGIRWTGR
jgi:antitoxin (DNA-binding transcriptional repressor) of toxin-antitoxin stability system